MKRHGLFISLLAALSILSGYLVSKASWIGRTGIDLLHKEYSFTKIWWEASSVVFATLLFFFLLHSVAQKKLPVGRAKIVHIIGIVVAIVGLYLTYHDFRHDFSHRLLGERFHMGVYLFWIGWMAIGLYYLAWIKEVVNRKDETPPSQV